MSDLDREVVAHLARMPGSHRQLLEPVVADAAPDGWLRDALLAYLRYFVRIFEHGEPRDAAESVLASELCGLIGREPTGDDDEDTTAAEAELARRLAERGYGFQGGRTPPYLGPYIWSRTEDRRFSVTLPGGQAEEVTVHFLHDFVIRGWLHWQTYGEQGAGGWYKQDDPDWPDGLYCVAERYPDPDTNRAFGVSLLGHEAQHVADHRAFPGLSSSELEYRAKLVELIGFEALEDRLAFFLSDAADDPDRPHPYAAHLIVERLAQRVAGRPTTDVDWPTIPYEDIRREAQALLDEDTARIAAER